MPFIYIILLIMLQKNKHLLKNANLKKKIATPKSLESWQGNKLL